MRSIAELLMELSIATGPAGTAPAAYKTLCPKCSTVRMSRRYRRKPNLRVVIQRNRLYWRCYHCGYQGTRYLDDAQDQRHGFVLKPFLEEAG